MPPLQKIITNLNPLTGFVFNSILNRPATAVLHVSKAGDDTDGSTWAKAFNNPADAMDACETDGRKHTVILIAPDSTFYDINRTGDPTWSANMTIICAHRRWSPFKNTHASATAVMKFTGKVAIKNMAVVHGDGVCGVIFAGSSFRLRSCGFNSEATTSATTAIRADGTVADIRGAIVDDVKVVGVKAHTTALELINCDTNDFSHIHIHGCLEGINISGANSNNNIFENIDLGLCTTAIKMTEGTSEHFYDIKFHGNTTNIDDTAITGNIWKDINGEFPIITEPDNFTGVAVNTGDGANVWTAVPVEVRASATSTKPFTIVGINLDAGTNEKYRIRLSSDNGVTWFDDIQVEDARNTTLAFPSGTAFIFNAGTQITAQSKSESSGVDNLSIWLKVQEI